MARERLKKRREAALEAEEQLIRGVTQTSELREHEGRPLDLSDDTPSWFMNRLLRREGVSHPLIERGRDVDEAIEATWRRLEPLQRRYSRLAALGAEASPREMSAYNLRRTQLLEETRARLPDLNRLIRDHNLIVPDALHRRPFPVDDTMKRLESDIPELSPPQPGTGAPVTRRGWLSRLIRRRGG